MRTYLRGPALRSTRMFGVAGRAEGLGTTLAKLRMMPADFAVAVGALRQMRAHTSTDSALLRRVDGVVLVLGRRHISLSWRTGAKPGVGEKVAFDASNYCISGVVPSQISLNPKRRASMLANFTKLSYRSLRRYGAPSCLLLFWLCRAFGRV